MMKYLLPALLLLTACAPRRILPAPPRPRPAVAADPLPMPNEMLKP